MHFAPERRVSSRTRWYVLAAAGERSRLAGSVAAPVLLAAAVAAVAAAAAAARAVRDPTLALAAPPTATVVRVAAAGGALEANKAERSAVTSLPSSRAGARPSTANGVDGSANDAKDASQMVASMPSLRRWVGGHRGGRWEALGLGLGLGLGSGLGLGLR